MLGPVRVEKQRFLSLTKTDPKLFNQSFYGKYWTDPGFVKFR